MKLAQKIAIGYIRTKLSLLSVVSKRKAAEKAFEIFATPHFRSKKKSPPVFEKAEKLSFKMEGVTVRGFRWNHDAAREKRKALILHGFESTVKNFDRYINPLIKKGYEVLAFDAPAHGESGGKQITLPVYIKTIETIVDKYGPVQSFMAHSFGGLAISLFIEKQNHHADTRIALIAPATETTTAIDSFCQLLKINEEVKKEFNQLIEEKAGVNPSYFSVTRALKKIRATVLWLHDEDDDITPLKDVEPLRQLHLPNIEFYITKGLGHRKIYRDNKVVKKIIEFL